MLEDPRVREGVQVSCAHTVPRPFVVNESQEDASLRALGLQFCPGQLVGTRQQGATDLLSWFSYFSFF